MVDKKLVDYKENKEEIIMSENTKISTKTSAGKISLFFISIRFLLSVD